MTCAFLCFASAKSWPSLRDHRPDLSYLVIKTIKVVNWTKAAAMIADMMLSRKISTMHTRGIITG